MLKMDDVTAIINEHVTDEEAKAAIGVALLEADLPEPDTSEIDSVKAELEAEREGRKADKAEYVERINKFIYGGDPGDEKPDVVEETEDAVEDKSFYERYMED